MDIFIIVDTKCLYHAILDGATARTLVAKEAYFEMLLDSVL